MHANDDPQQYDDNKYFRHNNLLLITSVALVVVNIYPTEVSSYPNRKYTTDKSAMFSERIFTVLHLTLYIQFENFNDNKRYFRKLCYAHFFILTNQFHGNCVSEIKKKCESFWNTTIKINGNQLVNFFFALVFLFAQFFHNQFWFVVSTDQ